VRQWWRKWVTGQFHKIFYRYDDQVAWRQATWLGAPALKCPFDLWVYQEIIFELRPDWIIESGTYQGGSALFLAGICDQIGHGQVLTIDVKIYDGRPQHARLTYLHGSSTAPETLSAVQSRIGPGDAVMVILDSEHGQPHVLQEMRAYSSMVSVGSYLVVEDTNLNGHPVWPDFGPGPMEAVRSFLKENQAFVSDLSREKFYLTFNPCGYLKRVR
jgi:cephalosporin hydroxylase